MCSSDFVFSNASGETLVGFLHESHIPVRAVIVFLHGFPGCSQYYVSCRMAEFSKHGFHVVRFDFSGSGKSAGRFYDKTLSKEMSDTRCAIDRVATLYPDLDILLVGHSTGAIVASLYAHRDPRISQLFLLGGVSNLELGVSYDFSDDDVRQFLERGYKEYHRPGHWLHGARLSRAYYDEFFVLSPTTALSKYSGPTLIVHGEADESVPIDRDPYELQKACSGPNQLAVVSNADHQFKRDGAWDTLTRTLVDFYESHVSSKLMSR